MMQSQVNTESKTNSNLTRNVYYISDGTGITAETLGRSLMTQFDEVDFVEHTIPYVETTDRAKRIVTRINELVQTDNPQPLLFVTLVNPDIRKIFADCNAVITDLFTTFVGPLEKALQAKSNYSIGKSHTIRDAERYKNRMSAVNYSLNHDDGVGLEHYDKADVILLGVSRCGKTPTSLYLALRYGLFTANYPLTGEELSLVQLPKNLQRHKAKLYGLTITWQQLQGIRHERYPNSTYSSAAQCQKEVRAMERMYLQHQIPMIDVTTKSVEEIASRIMVMTGLLA